MGRATAFGIALLLAVAPRGAAAPVEPLKPETTLEIRSYGERSTELIELLIPFLAAQDFGESRPRRTTDAGTVSAGFSRGADSIKTTGTPNCLVVAYFSTLRPGARGRGDPVERAALFRKRLLEFLHGLPTPRPSAR